MDEHIKSIYAKMYDYMKQLHGGAIILETPEIALKTVFDVTPEDLLSIANDEDFAIAIYTKLFNRLPQDKDIRRVVLNIKRKSSRENEIKKIINSPEFLETAPKLSSIWRDF